jgi:hypothetical protein
MKRMVMVLALVLIGTGLIGPAGAQAVGRQGGVYGIHAGVTCHDPCDDPFQLKAWVSGDSVGGLKVKFVVKGRAFTARTSSSGFAHYHLDISPAGYPQGEVVKVTASVRHGGATRTDSTWFKPNYD